MHSTDFVDSPHEKGVDDMSRAWTEREHEARDGNQIT